MNISRYLKSSQIRLGLVSGHLDQADPEKDPDKERARLKEAVMEELTGLFELSGAIRNRSKFFRDFQNRERSGTTGIGGGIALPHIRSLQPRRTVIVFARTQEGVWYDALDGELTHIFFGIAAPEYDDREFYSFHKWISNAFLQEDWLPAALLAAEDEHEIIKILGQLH